MIAYKFLKPGGSSVFTGRYRPVPPLGRILGVGGVLGLHPADK